MHMKLFSNSGDECITDSDRDASQGKKKGNSYHIPTKASSDSDINLISSVFLWTDPTSDIYDIMLLPL